MNVPLEQRQHGCHGHRIALCLGAHRSGTSLVAAAMEAAGAQLSLGELNTSEENPKGFFEHPEVLALNESILHLSGSAWDDAIFDSRRLLALPATGLDELRDRALRIVEGHFLPNPLSGIKDPRMCRLLPFWLSVLESAGYAKSVVRCIIVTRSPIEVALSQQTRCHRNPDYYEFGRSIPEGVALWLNHIRQAIRDSREQDALIVSYQDFLDRPAELMGRMAGFMGAVPDETATSRFVSDFVSKSLWRSHANEDLVAEVSSAFPGLLDAERALAALSGETLSDQNAAAILDSLCSPEIDHALERVVSSAYGRLSWQRRSERMDSLKTENALDVAIEARDAFARSRDEVAVAAKNVEQNLRDQIGNLEASSAAVLAEVRERHDTDLRALRADFGSALREKDASLSLLSAELEESRQASAFLQRVTEEIYASRSWRATRPLRAMGHVGRDLKALPKAGLRALNRTCRLMHQRLKRSHPRTAEVLRRNIQPLMLRANMRVLGQVNALPPAVAPAEGFDLDYQKPGAEADYRPLVTIIVPNFNHAPYLRQRLESIYAQGYDNYEVLLLDDCSPDNSREVLGEFAARYPHCTRVFFNEENSGGVFHQWEKGLSEARGALIWIAESDDWASPNFLETLVPFFRNEAVQLAYARTVFMDSAGENQIWSMEEYLSDLGPERWGRPWVETAPTIVREAFSIKNIIPNVSSAMFRRFDRRDVLEIGDWRGMRTCGDWMFYLNAMRGGLLAYSPEAQNFYRIHEKNTSVISHKTDQFYREHEEVAKCLRRHYRVPARSLDRMEANLREHWQLTRDDYSDEAFAASFDRNRIMASPARKPSLLMVGYAFCAGGGETFPIQLANEMKAIGHEVTFLDCAQEERVPGVRARLANDIPVIGNFPDLRRIVANFDIDVIHSHHGWADNTVLDILPEDSDCRTVITLHGFYETVPPAQLKQLLPRLLRRTSAMVYIAEKNLSAMQVADQPQADGMFHRIDNAVSAVGVSPISRAALGIAEDAFLLTIVSRALHAKGWAEAVASTTRAREISGRDIQLILVGEGEAKTALEAAGVPDHVHLEGFRSNTQDYFAASDLGFLPSRFKGESFPLVVIESLMAGTPVLASNIGEIAYMLQTGAGPAGCLFDLTPDWQIDVEALAQTIAALANDPEQMSRLRERVAPAAIRFDPRNMAEKYSSVYTGAVSGLSRAG